MSARRLERVILATEFGFRSIKLIELRASSTCRVADDFVKRFLPSFKYHNASLEFKYTSVDEAKGSKKPQQKDQQQGEGSTLPEGLDVHKDVVIIDFNDNHRQVLGLHLYPQASLLAQRILRLDRERDILQRIRESNGERFERKVKRRLEEEINRRVEDGLKDEEFQKEIRQAVDEARSNARKKMLEEVEAEKVSIQKEFDKKLEAAKEPASQNESTVEEASSVSATKVQESEAEALRKEKKLERLRRIAEEREKYSIEDGSFRLSILRRMQSGLSPKQAPAAATSSRTKSNSGPSISFSLKKPGR
ncbi:hypothetical protein FOZ63_014661 [Perkinsus olseni]|uniref:Uncharacterized protein n=1 Tax=Perkinsus olseni TaxID=32597 RepID=A0A7J6PQ36_PEROL|nr:hypothetical protein FOZ63_014661 [Perkinsus olseni]KAF4706340.1 hypothetical protein FOZ62_005035 [Perkinsus olseni]